MSKEWDQWERQRRFAIEKTTNPLTGLCRLVVRDLWQKRHAVIHGLTDDEYENARLATIATIANGQIDHFAWVSDVGGVRQFAGPSPSLGQARLLEYND